VLDIEVHTPQGGPITPVIDDCKSVAFMQATCQMTMARCVGSNEAGGCSVRGKRTNHLCNAVVGSMLDSVLLSYGNLGLSQAYYDNNRSGLSDQPSAPKILLLQHEKFVPLAEGATPHVRVDSGAGRCIFCSIRLAGGVYPALCHRTPPTLTMVYPALCHRTPPPPHTMSHCVSPRAPHNVLFSAWIGVLY
jgi:hypothetical protein